MTDHTDLRGLIISEGFHSVAVECEVGSLSDVEDFVFNITMLYPEEVRDLVQVRLEWKLAGEEVWKNEHSRLSLIPKREQALAALKKEARQ